MNYQAFSLRSAFRCALALVVVSLAIPVFGQQQTVFHEGRPAVANQILVRLRSNDAGALTRVRGAAPFAAVDPLNTELALHIVRSPGNSIPDLLRAFSGRPDVLYAEPDYILHSMTTTPNDTLFPSLWGMTKIAAPLAWDITTGGTSFVAGVVDSGVDYTHPDLAGNIWSAPTAFTVTIAGINVNCPAGSHGFNAITFSCDPRDDNNHGSHTAGTIGASGNNSIGVAGLNWQGRIMGLKFLSASGSGPTSAAINSIEFAIRVKQFFSSTATPVNVRVLSNSWGGGPFSSALVDEINKANTNEMLFVAAAGNEGTNNDITPEYPANYSTILPNVVAVAATDSSDNLAAFSNYGLENVQLGAPGVGILSTIRSGAYSSFSGTSMATPHVAGAALLTLTACPTLTTAALKNALLANVDAAPSLAGKTVTGGRLNVNRAVRSCSVVSTLAASFVGATGEDLVGPAALAPSGVLDWHIQLTGLRGTPTKVRITSAAGGGWESPYNGLNWNIRTQYGAGGTTGDLFYEPWGSGGFHVKVFYSDGSTDEVDATTGAPPPPPPPPPTGSLTAAFVGATGADLVGPGGQTTPNGIPDWRIQVGGLRSTPTKVRITSTAGGGWESPFNGSNWVILPQYGAGGATGDLYFDPWGSPGFHVKVFYSDGTTDEVDATTGVPPPPPPPPPPGTLTATFLGTTGQDFVGPIGQTTPSGVQDWHIRLGGLLGTPIKVRITSTAGGTWESPFNGSNWVIFPQYGTGGAGDLFFEPWGSAGFHVKVFYSDGTTDEVDAL